MFHFRKLFPVALSLLLATSLANPLVADVGVGANPIDGAEMLLDGTKEMLDAKWIYWQGPGFKSSMPIKWKIVDDPVDSGTVVQTDDPAAAGGKYGAADIVTKKEYRDFRLHVEFNILNQRGNSGVYLQNRHEIQIVEGDATSHGLGAIINESESPYYAFNGLGAWNSYDIVFRAARFSDGKRVEKARTTMYFNGQKAHTEFEIEQVWGGPNSGIDGANDGGRGITDTPGGIKLQCEGHDVRYRNTWIKELDLAKPITDFTEPLSIVSKLPNGEVVQALSDDSQLSNWVGDKSIWSNVNGMIRGANEERVQSSTYLFTKKSYREFRVLLDVKQTMSPKHATMHSAVAALGEPFTDAGDNAFGFRGPLLMFCHDWGIWDAHRRNRIAPVEQGNAAERRGEWNRIEILVIGDRIRMVANGKDVIDFTDKPEMLRACPIGLQIHSNAKPQEYFFRHVLIIENPKDSLVTLR